MPSDPYPLRDLLRRLRVFLRRHGALVLLVAADAATKVAAFRLLPQAEPVTVLPGLRLYLAVNEWGVMGGVHGLGAVTRKPLYTMLLAAGLVVLALCIMRLAATRLSFGRRVLVAMAVFLGVSFVAEAGSAAFGDLLLPAPFVVASIRAAVLVVAVALYAASRVPRARAPLRLLAAGALANAASSAYPPYEVVDFLMVPLAPVATLLGRGVDVGGAGAVGVVNLADLYLFAVPMLLAVWPLAALASRLRGRRARRRQAAAGRRDTRGTFAPTRANR